MKKMLIVEYQDEQEFSEMIAIAGGFDVDIKTVAEREASGIRAKALRKRGTDQWYYFKNEYLKYFCSPIPEPLPPICYPVPRIPYPNDAELVDVIILVTEPDKKGGQG